MPLLRRRPSISTSRSRRWLLTRIALLAVRSSLLALPVLLLLLRRRSISTVLSWCTIALLLLRGRTSVGAEKARVEVALSLGRRGGRILLLLRV